MENKALRCNSHRISDVLCKLIIRYRKLQILDNLSSNNDTFVVVPIVLKVMLQRIASQGFIRKSFPQGDGSCDLICTLVNHFFGSTSRPQRLSARTHNQ